MSLRVTDEEYKHLRMKAGKEWLVVTQPVTFPKRNKMGAIKKEVDGLVFDSTAEARRYEELKLLATAGDIQQLRMQPEYSLDVNGIHICNYIADFVYFRAGEMIVEDVKGVKTPVYIIKRKLLKACTGLDITEIKARR